MKSYFEPLISCGFNISHEDFDMLLLKCNNNTQFSIYIKVLKGEYEKGE